MCLVMQFKNTGIDRAAAFIVDGSVSTLRCRLDIAQTRLRFGPPLTSNAPPLFPLTMKSHDLRASLTHLLVLVQWMCADAIPRPLPFRCH